MDETDWTLIDFEPPKKAAPVVPAVVTKGHCEKCGRHIGKGLFVHMKACDGNPSKTQ